MHLSLTVPVGGAYTIAAFAGRIHAPLAVMEGGEHWFHTPDQMAFLDRWVTDPMEVFARREDPTASAAMLLGLL